VAAPGADPTSNPLYNRIGVGYDATRRADIGIVRQLVELLAAPAGVRCLDVACGTGNYTTALAEAGLRLHGLEISSTMLASARAKSEAVHWVAADATAIPFADGTFRAAVCTLALHHFRQPDAVFGEIARVLDQDARLVVLTAAREQMRCYWLNEYFPDALERSIVQMPPLDQTIIALHGAGFDRVTTVPFFVSAELQDLFLYAGKYRPALYLDPVIRAGISTFANLAEPAELVQGCARLEADLASGRFVEVLAASERGVGDYLFLVASRRRSGLGGR
jgi:ubiquinone/menaquinone biosynthesis C-methylase UbiE